MIRVLPRGLWAVVSLLGVVLAPVACKVATRDNPDVCDDATKDYCAEPRKCVQHVCVLVDAGASTGGGGGAAASAGGANGTAGNGAAGQTLATGGAAGGSAGSVGSGGAGGGSPDGGVIDGPVSDHPDAAKPCTGSGTCTDPLRPVCIQGKCGCSADGDCPTDSPACNLTANVCEACTKDDSCTGHAGLPHCSAGACVMCAKSDDCPATTPICDPTKHTCGACSDDDGCAKRLSSALPHCDAQSKACVECTASAHCAADPKKPICGATLACASCAGASAMSCAQKDAAHPVCGADGSCVECGADTDCHDPTKAFCSAAGACVSCASAPGGAGACAAKNPARPACGPTGACVQCVAKSDCASTTPVCSGTNTCGPCTADADCAGRSGPGVCMSHQDGRCATDAETLYVQATSGVCSETGTGTTAAPFCTMQPAVAALSAARNLVVVRGTVNGSTAAVAATTKPVTVVGQMSGLLVGGANPAFHLASGEAYLRDIKFGPSPGIGVQADASTTIRMQHVVVSGNAGGGILLDGAAFEIHNASVTNNGPGTSGAITWAGILVNPPPSGSKLFDLVTVQGNNQVGVSCSAAVQAMGVLATSNVGGVDIISTCMFSSCGTASATCGAQP